MPEELKSLSESQKLTILCAQLADDKLASNVFVLDLRKLDSAPSEYFVIASCDSANQVHAIVSLILENCTKYELVKPKIEGYEAGEWVILDFFDVVIHLMLTENRNFYKIEKLWGDSEMYTIDTEGDMHPIELAKAIEIYNQNLEQ